MHTMEWILLQEKLLQEKSGNEGLRIQHAQSDYWEKKVSYRDKKGRHHHYHLDGYFVDAWGHEHAYELNGCWYHGCPHCFSRDREALYIQGKNIQQHYIETIKKLQQLWDMGFVVHSIWSCDYLRERDMLGDDATLPTEKCQPLNIRDFGGRTNAIVLHSEFLQNSKGVYLDFCSLHPYVLKYERYPVGHPSHVTNNFSPHFKVHCKA